LLLIVLAMSLSGCSGAATPAPTQPTPAPQVAATEAPAAPEATAAPASLPQPTAELTPTAAAGEQAAPTLAPTSELTATMGAQATTAPAAQGSAPAAAPADSIWNATSRMAQQAYRATIVTTTTGALSGNGTRTITMEYAPPGRMHMIMPGGMETIVLEDQGAIYMKTGSGAAWTQMPASMVQSILSNMPMSDPKQISQLKQQIIVDQTRFVGPDLVNGTPALVYDYATRSATDSSIVHNSRVWVGVTNRLPLKVQTTSNSPSGTGQTTTVVTYQYDSSITVQAPQ
jgi:hypothetical protein